MILEFGMSSTLSHKVKGIIFRNHLKFILNLLNELVFVSYLTGAVKFKGYRNWHCLRTGPFLDEFNYTLLCFFTYS